MRHSRRPRVSYKDIALDSRRFEECLAELRQYRAWEKVPVEKPYGTEDRMLVEELGRRAEEIWAQLRALKLQEAEARGELGKWGGEREQSGNQVDNVNLSKGGNALPYTYRRLLRDRPDLAE